MLWQGMAWQGTAHGKERSACLAQGSIEPSAISYSLFFSWAFVRMERASSRTCMAEMAGTAGDGVNTAFELGFIFFSLRSRL